MSEDTAAPPEILLADDDPAVLEVYGFALRQAGFEVTDAPDGKDALAALEVRSFDALVLDILMPGATGWEVLARAVEKTPAGRPLPRAILITGFHQEYVVDMGVLRREGVSAMLLKPFLPEDLIHEVRRALAAESKYALPRSGQPASS